MKTSKLQNFKKIPQKQLKITDDFLALNQHSYFALHCMNFKNRRRKQLTVYTLDSPNQHNLNGRWFLKQKKEKTLKKTLLVKSVDA